MFKLKGQRGQGSIEYLMILAAVLAIAVVVVVLATTFFTRYQEPAQVSSDKSVCGAAQIQLMNYFQRYENATDAGDKLKIKYLGKVANCSYVADTSSLGMTASTSCKIGTTKNTQIVVFAGMDGGDAVCKVADVP
ncbi:MAG: class III signal peptide-containing protein [Candidatus Diapherotrites archaeon]|nr:class III signal peptide-containing protein [Candidatus Diapherotrites archaeon]